MINITKIYYLHKGDNIPFYVGKTTKVTSRKSHHKKNKNGYLEIIDEVPTDEWMFWEKHYISLFKSWGFILENKNNGGGGSTFLTKEQKEKISNSKKNNTFAKGNKHSEEWKKNMSEKMKGPNHPNYGKKQSEETCRKKSESKKGSKQSKKTLKKRSEAMKGKIFSEQHKINHQNAIKNRWINTEKSDKNKPKHSPEGKQTIREKLWKPILQYDLEGNFIKEWPSTNHAAEYYNVTASSITRNIHNMSKTSCGFKWKQK
jgi:hypothetical protein